MIVPSSVRSASWYKRMQLKYRRQSVRKRVIRISLLASNVVVLAVILVFVLQNPQTATVSKAAPLSATTATVASVANPLDQLSSANIALTVARADSLAEVVPIANQAQTQAADLATASTEDSVISKPQVPATALKSRADIETYTTQAGDTVSNLAAKFGITSMSIRWSNNLSSGDSLKPGLKLVIPPLSGLVYTVKAGDTPASLAAKYNANATQIIEDNDAELHGLHVGEQIIIRNAVQVAAATANTGAVSFGGLAAWGGSPKYGFNGYDFGFCTWYVATQISVPANWGNASSWAYYARQDGWHVSSHPSVGAVAQRLGGAGHVAVVRVVNPDGSIWVQEMNAFGQVSMINPTPAGGWDRVDWDHVSAGSYSNYITH